jgi:hypothetical protein
MRKKRTYHIAFGAVDVQLHEFLTREFDGTDVVSRKVSFFYEFSRVGLDMK